MNFWRRAIAILVLMVFTPASVLAGTPLRFCVGDDGHRAIEFVLTADHHADDATGHHADCPPSGDYHVEPLSGCSDTPLLSAAQKPIQPAQHKHSITLDDLPIFALLVTMAAIPAVADAPRADPEPVHTARRHLQLDALRTVVLLI